MNNKVLMDNLRCIPDFPQPGINFRDVTTLFKNHDCLQIMVDELYDIYKDKGITKIVGIESRGFVIASALAVRLGAGVVPTPSRSTRTPSMKPTSSCSTTTSSPQEAPCAPPTTS